MRGMAMRERGGEEAPGVEETGSDASTTTAVNRTPTVGLDRGPGHAASSVRRFRLRIVDGGEVGHVFESTRDRVQLGSHPLNDLLLDERTVSRFHCEVFVDEKGNPWVKDLGSRNGTVVDGVPVKEAALRSGSLLQLGRVALRFELSGEKNRIAVSEQKSFGSLVGTSIAARSSFALMERAAASDVTVLLEGETGTGKSQAAESIHSMSARKAHPFRVVDCGAIPANLLESELFGHEKGAFTGATTRRVGVFEEARGGTVFLDEIGELPTELQPKLLRVLEAREIRRLGTNAYVPVDVRLIAATNRDLRAEVNAGRFRPDLYFRLAVVKITVPPLRQRPEDIPVIAEKMLGALGVDPRVRESLKDPIFLAQLQRAAWPGNMRELRNHLERCVVMQETLEPGLESEGTPSESPVAVDPRVPYPEARRRALEAFEHAYVKALLELHKGKVALAAESADIDRVHLYRLIKRHHVKD
jgi:two-component system, NtrC family, response regulator GlrR